jgi:hypothetical protein
MERIAQYLDDLEDIVYAVALVGERLRRVLQRIITGCVALCTLAFAFLLALSQPPLALALVAILMVTALYRAAVGIARGTVQRSNVAGA